MRSDDTLIDTCDYDTRPGPLWTAAHGHTHKSTEREDAPLRAATAAAENGPLAPRAALLLASLLLLLALIVVIAELCPYGCIRCCWRGGPAEAVTMAAVAVMARMAEKLAAEMAVLEMLSAL